MTDAATGRAAFVAVALLCLGSIAGCGGSDAAGKLVVIPKTIDFGRVVHGRTAVRTLTVRNESDRSIVVSTVTPNCACFTLGRFDHTLPAGEETTVEVTLISGSVPAGRLRGKRLQIVSTDPQAPIVDVGVEADLVAYRTVKPVRLDVGTLDDAARAKIHRIRVRGAMGFSVRPLNHTSSPPGLFDVAVEDAENGFDLVVRIADDAKGSGHLNGVVAIEMEASEGDGPPERFRDLVRVSGRWP